MLLLGIDLGTSSIKVSVIDSQSLKVLGSAQYPEKEATVISLRKGWAEQSPEAWWQHTLAAFNKIKAHAAFDPKGIAAIGIAYQMHGLVVVDDNQKVLRNSIIWCDSRAVETGNRAYAGIPPETCDTCLLNSPGNFTASKLGWVKENEPEIFARIDRVMLPGDYLAMRLTGSATTTPSALSEGIFWDFRKNRLSEAVLAYFGFNKQLFPENRPVFANHGELLPSVAAKMGLQAGIPVSYKAGDQLNNAVSLNVFNPGEVAATAGTSGVIYAVTDRLFADKQSRVNGFAHVNHSSVDTRVGVLLCINGTGIMNRWVKDLTDSTYTEMNERAKEIAPGSGDLRVLPFGNGAERVLNNKIIGAQLLNVDLNVHTDAHLFRATQEGIAYALRYGLDIMRTNGIDPSVIRAGRANMFLSDLFTQIFVDTTGVPVELYENDGSVGAAIGAGIGAGVYSGTKEAFRNFQPLKTVTPSDDRRSYDALYGSWKESLEKFL
ncbi:MAG TPA: FGGY family carbohydrate kinase [Chitinophagaceae bacterium]